jgi:hypothetical protein
MQGEHLFLFQVLFFSDLSLAQAVFNEIRYCRLAGIDIIGTLRRAVKTRIFEKVNKMFFYKQHAKTT